ncbi:hypothetical protein DFJ67_2749 [Asanoa ferruginea]|uniref:Ribosomally synthesized peptide with SipW-like signal peptide n=1 Tax=Asanoa ferruginea TaxID=53367 RepID=A0A3D9ZH89_9ACTN|nr:hypothetical protein [Asanoa ferruginea]REF96758.1 hypothetical protein DFJ67_2749 [Asanoa ferruginea]GIF53380.1 hypothetical protein Afe04nite_79190 [Asanoa ferruginea]
MRNISQRTAVITLVVVIVAGIASVAWAAWSVTGNATATVTASEVTALQATATPTGHLFPGGSAAIEVSVTNPNDFAVEVQSFSKDPRVTVDAAHAKAGCTAASVRLKPTKTAIAQRVDGDGGTKSFVVEDAVEMLDNAPQSCQGASFEITLALAGVSLPD